MAFNLLSGKIEKGDWTCGAADDVAATSSRAKPDAARNAVVGFVLGALTGGAYLYWQDMRKHIHRMKLPENA